MCGIVGLHLRDPELYPWLGTLLEAMLIEMTDRGPDSAGIAVYSDDTGLAVHKGIGRPADVARGCDLAGTAGWQGLGHTRMATESAVTVEGCHPFSVGQDQCLVHNGSFSNHATIRRELADAGVTCESLSPTAMPTWTNHRFRQPIPGQRGVYGTAASRFMAATTRQQSLIIVASSPHDA
ncbi:MAG TPA: hypothetical protein VGG75_41280 [Trebonia sp.]|jgi:glucosamine 6-phosphate synthetase-like amidotransferase/phosphosugar isomerase protein